MYLQITVSSFKVLVYLFKKGSMDELSVHKINDQLCQINYLGANIIYNMRKSEIDYIYIEELDEEIDFSGNCIEEIEYQLDDVKVTLIPLGSEYSDELSFADLEIIHEKDNIKTYITLQYGKYNSFYLFYKNDNTENLLTFEISDFPKSRISKVKRAIL